jgi:CheY-like chemotaxis protein
VQATILVIEDDPPSLELMTYLLNAHGFTTLTADRGDDGIAMARRERPDLIICDIQLPGVDGYEIARLLKSEESLRSMPLVAVTALAMVGDREKVLAAGFDEYVSKPIDPATFVALIEPLLGRMSSSKEERQWPRS